MGFPNQSDQKHICKRDLKKDSCRNRFNNWLIIKHKHSIQDNKQKVSKTIIKVKERIKVKSLLNLDFQFEVNVRNHNQYKNVPQKISIFLLRTPIELF